MKDKEEYISILKQDNAELKKQLEEYIKSDMKLKDELFNKRKEYQDTYKDVRIEIKEYKNQQKAFIKWLEAMSIMYENEYKDIDTAGHYNCVLQKYREIIGDDK